MRRPADHVALGAMPALSWLIVSGPVIGCVGSCPRGAGEVTSGRRTGLEGSSFWMLGGEVLAVWAEVMLWLWCGGGAQYSK